MVALLFAKWKIQLLKLRLKMGKVGQRRENLFALMTKQLRIFWWTLMPRLRMRIVQVILKLYRWIAINLNVHFLKHICYYGSLACFFLFISVTCLCIFFISHIAWIEFGHTLECIPKVCLNIFAEQVIIHSVVFRAAWKLTMAVDWLRVDKDCLTFMLRGIITKWVNVWESLKHDRSLLKQILGRTGFISLKHKLFNNNSKTGGPQ